MTQHSVTHSNFTIERDYPVSPARVFAAWATAEALLRWAAPGDDWVQTIERFEFRVGGGETSRFGPKGGAPYVNETRYEDIVPNARIVSSGAMTHEGVRLFAGILTLTFEAAGQGCRCTLTEQGVFLDGHDVAGNHEGGWNVMLDKLGLALTDQALTA